MLTRVTVRLFQYVKIKFGSKNKNEGSEDNVIKFGLARDHNLVSDLSSCQNLVKLSEEAK